MTERGGREGKQGEEGDGQAGPEGARARLLNTLREHRRAALAVGLAVALLAGGLVWWRSTFWESTDDAQVDGHLTPVSARIAGHVAAVRVDDNQIVRAGAVLVEIDPASYRVALDRARADYANAVAAAEAARIAVPISSTTTRSGVSAAQSRVANARAAVDAAQKESDAARARLNEAEANRVRAQADFERYRALAADGIVSRQQYDQALAEVKAQRAAVDAARAAVKVALAHVVEAQGQVTQADAELRTARTGPEQVAATRARADSAAAAVQTYRAAQEQAELDLSYTKVLAPVDGVVGNRQAEVGQNVQPGQELLTLVPLGKLWVTANFKETQLAHMRAGQEAEISVDAYGRRYRGHVESVGAASGSRFSLFPPENATGNFVKVVQRLPVRVALDPGQDPGHLLRPGLSVEVSVRVR